MHIEQTLRAVAGFFVMLSAGLAHWHSPYWLVFTAFVGINLFQSAFTGWCPMVSILRAAGMKRCGEGGPVTDGDA